MGHISNIRSKLNLHSPGNLAESARFSHSAVSIVLREVPPSGGTQVLMIRRAEHPHDPWSGHMGFPGGHVDSCDVSAERAAVRETNEELGFHLDSCANCLGRLSEIQARVRAKLVALSIVPFVYELVEPVSFRLNCEVIEALWIPLQFFLSPANRTEMRHPHDDDRFIPCYRWQERVIWGHSLTMLDELLFDL